jgi:hypothetical protein
VLQSQSVDVLGFVPGEERADDLAHRDELTDLEIVVLSRLDGCAIEPFAAGNQGSHGAEM